MRNNFLRMCIFLIEISDFGENDLKLRNIIK